MEPALIPAFSKSKSNKSENHWHHSNNHTLSEGFDRSHSTDRQNHHLYLMAYLILEKNVSTLVQRCKKLLAKQKRAAFRKIFEFRKSNRNDKTSENGFTMTQLSKQNKQIQKDLVLTQNPELHSKEIVIICLRQAQLSLNKLVHSLQRLRLKALLGGWMQVKTIGHCWIGEINILPHKSSLYVIEKHNQQSEHMGKGNSRMSNKRKTTKCRQDHKQNSHVSAAQLSLQNQRLRNELMQEEQERCTFIDQLGELLDYHQKYLAQGSTTTRTKKNK